MASELIVKVQRIHSIKPHPNADRLEVACIGAEGGWETCVKKEVFHPGDLVVYIPPDSLLPRQLHEHLGITNYCGELPASSTEAAEGFRRVKAARLRGYKSFGTLMTFQDIDKYLGYVSGASIAKCLAEGEDVALLLGVKKWIPKEKVLCGEAATPCSWFHRYTDIQNIKNHPGLFKDGEQVIISEKIHGTNCRVGLAADITTEDGNEPYILPANGHLTWMAGSNTVQRKEFDSENRKSRYWEPLDNQKLRDMIEWIAEHKQGCFSVVVFGEIFGAGVQDMNYGLIGKSDFRVFDIAINGDYMDWSQARACCDLFEVKYVPELYEGEFSQEVVEQFTDGPTTLSKPDQITCKFKGREGIVIKPVKERTEPELTKGNGRLILKSVSVDYLERKGAIDNA